ncbi:hypothetical protein CTJ15_01780 (plasmid) [Roseomonas sp. FDAARGOS_362]|nr:hypothetical protein CTJ15_01780 [Roseomonas sp. FDAARGOS_362]
MSGENTKRYTAAELREMSQRGESRTDLARLRAMTDEEVEKAAAEELAEEGISPDWYKDAEAVSPRTKVPISIRLDADIVDDFRSRGRGWQTHLNSVLRAYLNAKNASAR